MSSPNLSAAAVDPLGQGNTKKRTKQHKNSLMHYPSPVKRFVVGDYYEAKTKVAEVGGNLTFRQYMHKNPILHEGRLVPYETARKWLAKYGDSAPQTAGLPNHDSGTTGLPCEDLDKMDPTDSSEQSDKQQQEDGITSEPATTDHSKSTGKEDVTLNDDNTNDAKDSAVKSSMQAEEVGRVVLPNRVSSIGVGEANPSASVEATADRRQGRKRKQDELEEETDLAASTPDNAESGNSGGPPDSSESDDDDDDDDDETNVPRTDNEKILSIVTKRLWSESSKDIVDAMKSLNKLVGDTENNDNNEENRKIALLRGAPLVITKAMSRNKNSLKVQTQGCRALLLIALCKHDDTEQTIIETGGLKCSLQAIKRHHDKPIIAEKVCGLIGNLWGSTKVRANVVEGGGLAAVIKAMDAHKQADSVQQKGCYALKELLRSESTWAEAAVEAGGVDAVIDAMANHRNHNMLQLYGCMFLRAVAKSREDYRNKILQSKGLIAIVEARRIHNNDAVVVREANKAIKSISEI